MEPGVTPSLPARVSPLERLPPWLLELRPHHWTKNVLVFVPLAAAHQLGELALFGRAALAFAAFSLAASGQYVLNDLLDLQDDRTDASRSLRPLASGRLGRATAIALMALSWIGAALLASRLGFAFAAVLATYVLAMIAYSSWLKQVVLLDALLLAAGYSARVAAGGIAVAITPSPWIVAFCVAIFFSLALVKRHAELARNRGRDGPSAHARGYQAIDLPLLSTFGVASGYLSVLVLGMYLTSGQASHGHYARPAFIGLTALLLLYWISYVWLVANRGQMLDDPMLFAARDRRSLVLMVLMGVAAWLAV
jgi:4-hydroxybenzoate polyprenyltransferase